MKKTLYFDTETSGLPDLGKPWDYDGNPHICQLAWLVTAGDRVVTQGNFVIAPMAPYSIDPGATRVTGITYAYVEAHGLPSKVVLRAFTHSLFGVTTIVGHNVAFDMARIRHQFARTEGFDHESIMGWMEARDVVCTMQMGTPICKLPPSSRMVKSGRTGHKGPKLVELYRHLFGVEMEGAHDAMADVQGTRRCHERMVSMSAEAPVKRAAAAVH